MSDYDTAEIEGTDIEPRDVRALTECMSVLDEGGDIYTVVGENSETYRVDRRETGRCTCPDAQYNLPTDDGRERCKHESRVAYATGDRPVPAWVDTDAVDPQLGAGVDATPQVAATDGGIVNAGDDAEIVDDTDGDVDDGRPDDCDCLPTFEDLPCFACYQAGYDAPNPSVGDE